MTPATKVSWLLLPLPCWREVEDTSRKDPEIASSCVFLLAPLFLNAVQNL